MVGCSSASSSTVVFGRLIVRHHVHRRARNADRAHQLHHRVWDADHGPARSPVRLRSGLEWYTPTATDAIAMPNRAPERRSRTAQRANMFRHTRRSVAARRRGARPPVPTSDAVGVPRAQRRTPTTAHPLACVGALRCAILSAHRTVPYSRPVLPIGTPSCDHCAPPNTP